MTPATLTEGLLPAVLQIGVVWTLGLPYPVDLPHQSLSHSRPDSSLIFQLVAGGYHSRLRIQLLPSAQGPWCGLLFGSILAGLFCSHLLSRPQAFQRQELLPPQWSHPAEPSRSAAAVLGSSCRLVAAPCSHFRGLTFQQLRDVFLQG